MFALQVKYASQEELLFGVIRPRHDKIEKSAGYRAGSVEERKPNKHTLEGMENTPDSAQTPCGPRAGDTISKVKN